VTEVKGTYPTVSLENAELFDAQSLLLSGMPGDLAFGGKIRVQGTTEPVSLTVSRRS
jgi:hypothetical protein